MIRSIPKEQAEAFPFSNDAEAITFHKMRQLMRAPDALCLSDGQDVLFVRAGLGWPAWIEPMSNTVYFMRPSDEIAEKYTLAPDYDDSLGGELSHIVVMQHVTQEHLQEFLDDMAAAVK